MWPFRESRAGVPVRDATEVAIAAMANRAAGKDARAETLAALEIAASYVGRAFASAVVTGPEAARLLTREALAMIGRSLVLRGELVMLPEGSALVPASTFDIRGGPDDWAYRCDFAGPSRSVSRFLPAPIRSPFPHQRRSVPALEGTGRSYSGDGDGGDGGERGSDGGE